LLVRPEVPVAEDRPGSWNWPDEAAGDDPPDKAPEPPGLL